jgi:hypothetical protein
MTSADDPQERPASEEERQGEQQEQDEGQQGESDGEGAGPAEDLQEDPAYNPQGPERKYKGG